MSMKNDFLFKESTVRVAVEKLKLSFGKRKINKFLLRLKLKFDHIPTEFKGKPKE